MQNRNMWRTHAEAHGSDEADKWAPRSQNEGRRAWADEALYKWRASRAHACSSIRAILNGNPPNASPHRISRVRAAIRAQGAHILLPSRRPSRRRLYALRPAPLLPSRVSHPDLHRCTYLARVPREGGVKVGIDV